LHDRKSLLAEANIKHGRAGARSTKIVAETAINKSLARAKSGAVREVLLLDRRHDRVNLPEIGMVAISVSIVSLNQEHEQWSAERTERREATHPPAQNDNKEPTQELILERIIARAHEWLDQETRLRPPDEGLQLLVLDASIVHGSSSFDMLLTILYREVSMFTRFVREVVQRTRHVNSSQTLQIPYRIGFPNFS
jgi:hypothetical protein